MQLCTKTIEKNANPEWNQLISLPVKVWKIPLSESGRFRFGS